MQFEFTTATRIIFGRGTIREAVPAATAWGRRVLVVGGRTPERLRQLCADLAAAGAEVCTFSVEGEPTVDLISRGLEKARKLPCDVVIAMGGGSAIDAGKAVAALLANPGEPMDYLEVVGKGKELQNPAAPLIAVATTAGTGSEVTRNAVLGVPQQQLKVSLRSPFLLPRLAIVDPELTAALPPAITARTGLDALTQLIEAYVSIRANLLTDGFCTQGIPLAASALRRAFQHGDDLEARNNLSLAALFSGLALANAGLGVIHGFAGPLGGRFAAPHGAVCAALLPHGIEINLRALGARAPQSSALLRYQRVAQMLTGQPDASAADAIVWTRRICRELEIPALRTYGVGEGDIAELSAEAAKASSMKGNPIVLTPKELKEVLSKSI